MHLRVDFRATAEKTIYLIASGDSVDVHVRGARNASGVAKRKNLCRMWRTFPPSMRSY
jgi:hypothetical protein